MAVTFIKKSDVVHILRGYKGSYPSYTVNMTKKTCSCPAFTDNLIPCEHLNAFGIFKEGNYTAKYSPSFSQALSALVKGIRLRDAFEAGYWLRYLWQSNDQSSAFKVARRLLIGATEDNFCVPVIERVSHNFSDLCSLSKRDYFKALAEVLRLCSTPNWWDSSTGGHEYIFDWTTAVRKVEYYNDYQVHSYSDLKDKLKSSVLSGDTVAACGYFTRFDSKKYHTKNSDFMEYLRDIALEVGSTNGVRVADCYLANKSALSGDSNFTGHVLYWSCKPDAFPIQDYTPVVKSTVLALFEAIEIAWTNPHVIPSWCCDGIHCAGNDRRFAGMIDNMAAACNVFKRTGGLSPNTTWIEGDWYLGGLDIQR